MQVIPNIPVIYDKFPDNYINDVNGWAFSEEIIKNNKNKLLTLDIDFGSYCSLNCPTCFRQKNSVDDIPHELKYDDLAMLITQAKELGLKSVKFLGAGEPLENEGFLDFLRFLKGLDIIPLIFTKGQVIGNDATVKKYFGKYGIVTGRELVQELNHCNASVLLNLNTFDNELQAKLVGGDKNYIHIRNRALQLLVEEGFNQNNPTRLALINSPVTIWNIDEAFDIYKWGRLRNLYTVTTPTMISGKAKNDLWKKVTPSEEKLIELYTNIYKFNIETNLQTLEQIEKEGIAAYAGAHPCNQISCGLYVTLNGVVLSCPGQENLVEGNYWDTPLSDIWRNSSNYKRSGTFNCECVAKIGKSIPVGLYNKVLSNLIL
jgi:MoaA/NifB/PqqE/SkfB family radical SAM enzyme